MSFHITDKQCLKLASLQDCSSDKDLIGNCYKEPILLWHAWLIFPNLLCHLHLQKTLSGIVSDCQFDLDPDQARQIVRHDLDLNCLQR